MDSNQFQQRKCQILNDQFPYKVIEKANLHCRANNMIELNGLEIHVTPSVQSTIDRFVGLTTSQICAVEESFGDKGTRDLRNYFALAGNSNEQNQIALIANPESRTIEGATAIRHEVISPEAFFDFAEMFMDRNDFYPVSISTGLNGIYGVELTMKPHQEEFDGFGPDDEFLKNGLYMKWSLAGIEMGSYIERLVCSNGATRIMPRKEATIYDMMPNSATKLLELPNNKRLMNLNWERHLEAAIIAKKTQSSVAEVAFANKLLVRAGVEADIAEQIAPIAMLIQLYAASGYDTSRMKCNRLKSDINFWELYNRLTYFASPTTTWSDSDIRRNKLMGDSMDFLTKKRDITEYLSIFD